MSKPTKGQIDLQNTHSAGAGEHSWALPYHLIKNRMTKIWNETITKLKGLRHDILSYFYHRQNYL